jgi:hypothetical protein
MFSYVFIEDSTGSIEQRNEIGVSLKIATWNITRDYVQEYRKQHLEIKKIHKWKDIVMNIYLV